MWSSEWTTGGTIGRLGVGRRAPVPAPDRLIRRLGLGCLISCGTWPFRLSGTGALATPSMPATAISSAVGRRRASSPAYVSLSSSTRLMVMWTGTHPPPIAANRNTPEVAPEPNSIVILAIWGASSGWTIGAPAHGLASRRMGRVRQATSTASSDCRSTRTRCTPDWANPLRIRCCEIVVGVGHVFTLAAPVHRSADQSLSAVVLGLLQHTGDEADGDRLTLVVGYVPGAAERHARLGFDRHRTALWLRSG